MSPDTLTDLLRGRMPCVHSLCLWERLGCVWRVSLCPRERVGVRAHRLRAHCRPIHLHPALRASVSLRERHVADFFRMAHGWMAGLLCVIPLAALATPSFDAVRAAHVPSERLVLDRQGEVIHRLRTDPAVRRGPWTPLEQVSPALIEAVVRSEDQRFFTHGGVDPLAVAAAGAEHLRRRIAGDTRGTRGASGITMQVAALLDPALVRPGGGRGLDLKWQQMQAAWALESGWSKAQILEVYLNRVPFRGELVGIAAASERLFSKAPHGLDAAESALLAALIRAPQAARQTVERRACMLLVQLARAEECARLAFLIDRWTLPESAIRYAAAERIAPHAARLLAQRLSGNTPIATTIDATLQREALAAIRRHLTQLANRNAHDAAVVVLDNGTGEVLAYVGSSGALSEAGAVDAARAPRQAGSTLKPFIYGLAIEKRLLTAATLLDDAPLAVDVGGGAYAPQNYGEDYAGAVSVRTALASSLNIPAIRALALVGVAPVHRLLREAGLTTLVADPEHYGHSLALGSADVTLLDLTNAYRALAQGGLASPVRWQQADAAAKPKRVLSPGAAWIVGDLLADRGARYLTFGFDNPLAVNHWAAVKTGTSKDMRDNWAIGWNARVTVGVWVGNAQGQPMHGVTGISGAGPIWAEVIEAAATRFGAGPPPAPPAEVAFAAVGEAGPSPARIPASAPARARPRREAFLTGTVPAHGIVAAREAPEVGARIVSPVDGTIIALDPDLPEAHQRVALVAGAPALANCFRLDTLPARSALLGCAERVLWRPEPGEHALVLLDAEGRERDRIRLVVRGAR